MALPHELTDEQRIAAVRQFAAALVERYGVAVDFAIHAPDRHSDERNYHAHVLMTTRRIGAERVWRKDARARRFHDGAARDRSDPARYGNESAIARWNKPGSTSASIAAAMPIRASTARRRCIWARSPRAWSATARRPISVTATATAQARNAERERIAGDRAAVSAEIIDLAAERERRAEERELRAAIRTGSPPRILEALTERRSTFSRGDLNRALAKVIVDPQGARGAHRPDFGAAGGGRAQGDRRRHRYRATRRGRCWPTKRGSCATPTALPARTGYGLTAAQGDRVLTRHPQLKEEQRAAFRHGTGASGLAVIAGEVGDRQEHGAGRDPRRVRGRRLSGHRHGLDQCRRAGHAAATGFARRRRSPPS